MAKLLDKFFNRVIEGEILELSDKEKEELGIGNVFSVEVTDIRNISNSILSKLKPGDIVLKITGKQKHTYIVSYKGEGAGEGICLTYVACGYMETVSYDRSGSSWVYNSTDVLVNPTKLYNHYVTVESTELLVINTSQDSLVGQNILDIFTECLCVKNSTGNYEPMLALASGGFYYISVGDIDTITFSNTEVISDEVLPL